MISFPTIGELYKAGRVSHAQLYTAVSAYLIDPTITVYPLADGVVINPFGAVRANSHATRVLAKPDATEAVKRNAVRAAILVSRPVEV